MSDTDLTSDSAIVKCLQISWDDKQASVTVLDQTRLLAVMNARLQATIDSMPKAAPTELQLPPPHVLLPEPAKPIDEKDATPKPTAALPEFLWSFIESAEILARYADEPWRFALYNVKLKISIPWTGDDVIIRAWKDVVHKVEVDLWNNVARFSYQDHRFEAPLNIYIGVPKSVSEAATEP